jgi:hypothetical protein
MTDPSSRLVKCDCEACDATGVWHEEIAEDDL